MMDYLDTNIDTQALMQLENQALEEYRKGSTSMDLQNKFQKLLPPQIQLDKIAFFDFNYPFDEYFGQNYDSKSEGSTRIFLSWKLNDDVFKGRNHPEFSKTLYDSEYAKQNLEKAINDRQIESYKSTMDDGGNKGFLTPEGVFFIYQSYIQENIQKRKNKTVNDQELLKEFRPIIVSRPDFMDVSYFVMSRYADNANNEFEFPPAPSLTQLAENAEKKRIDLALRVNIVYLGKKIDEKVKLAEKAQNIFEKQKSLLYDLKKSDFFIGQFSWA